MATRSGSQTHPGTLEYDIHVLAFPAATPRTVQGLCELFAVDASTAQRVIASVPVVLQRHVPQAEAEACAQALRKLGARVVLEPPQPREPPPPPPAAYLQHTANWPGAGRGGANDNLPRPVAHAAAPDLEYDVLSALDAALDGHEPVRTAASSRNLAEELALEQLEEPMSSEPLQTDTLLGQGEPDPVTGRHDELDLGGGAARGSFELELDGGAARHPARPREAQAKKSPGATSAERAANSGTTQPRLPIAPTGAARGRTQERSDGPGRSRSLPLLQLLGACGVFAAGYWTDHSVIYGSASLPFVLLHGLALQQLWLGLRGVLR